MKRLRREGFAKYHDVGWPFPENAISLFSELRLPDATVRLLDRRVHLRALDEAGRKLSELLRQSGRRNS
ncbi:MAG: hypothetical protein K0Q60_2697 [Microvirga sp.]|nr:hypothetical protein [Microvirga sp.]